MILKTWRGFLPTSELSAEKRVITKQRHARILALIDTLPAREREVLLLSAVQELSTVEIALVLDTTESTIRSRLYRARHALAALLEQKEFAMSVHSEIDDTLRRLGSGRTPLRPGEAG